MGPEPVPRSPGPRSPSSTLCPCPQPAPSLVYIPKNALLGEGGGETSSAGGGDDWVSRSLGGFMRSPDGLLGGCRVDWLCKSRCLQSCGEKRHESQSSGHHFPPSLAGNSNRSLPGLKNIETLLTGVLLSMNIAYN